MPREVPIPRGGCGGADTAMPGPRDGRRFGPGSSVPVHRPAPSAPPRPIGTAASERPYRNRRTGTAASMTPAVDAARKAGIPFELLSYAHDPAAESYGLEAAEALGAEPASVYKTLVASVDGALAVALVPVDRSLDLKALAAALGGKRAEMAAADAAQRATGYVLGGISPLGQRRRLPTVVHADALALPTIHVSAGRRGLELALDPADLVRLTGARTAPIAR